MSKQLTLDELLTQNPNLWVTVRITKDLKTSRENLLEWFHEQGFIKCLIAFEGYPDANDATIVRPHCHIIACHATPHYFGTQFRNFKSALKAKYKLKGNADFSITKILTTVHRTCVYMCKELDVDFFGFDSDLIDSLKALSNEKYDKKKWSKLMDKNEVRYSTGEIDFSDFVHEYFNIKVKKFGMKPNRTQDINYLLCKRMKIDNEFFDSFCDKIIEDCSRFV